MTARPAIASSTPPSVHRLRRLSLRRPFAVVAITMAGGVRTFRVSYPEGTSPAEVAAHLIARRRTLASVKVRRAYYVPGLGDSPAMAQRCTPRPLLACPVCAE